jgi:hypothetical protein
MSDYSGSHAATEMFLGKTCGTKMTLQTFYKSQARPLATCFGWCLAWLSFYSEDGMYSAETSDSVRTTRLYNPEDGTLHAGKCFRLFRGTTYDFDLNRHYLKFLRNFSRSRSFFSYFVSGSGDALTLI